MHTTRGSLLANSLCPPLPAGCATVAISLAEKFQGPDYRPWRAALFAGLGLFGLVPVIHGYLLHLDVLEVHKALSWDMAMGVVYLVGASWRCLSPVHSISKWCISVAQRAVLEHGFRSGVP